MLLPIKKDKKDKKDKEEDKILDILEKHLEAEENLLLSFKDKNFNEILKHIISIKELRKESFKILKKNKKDDIDEFEIELNEDVFESFGLKDENILKKYDDAKKEVINIYKVLEKNEIPVLNLDYIRDFLIEFSKIKKDDDFSSLFSSSSSLSNIDINEKILVLTNKDEKIPLIFKNGKKTILTKKIFDLSNFTYDELLEILRFLDIIISDNSYDYLRTEITKQIVSISTISQIDKN